MEVEVREIRSGRKLDAELRFVTCFLIILSQLFTNFGGAGAHDGILAGVVVHRTAEDFDTERSLLQGIEITGEGLFCDAAQQVLAAPAPAKQRAAEHAL